MSSPEKTGRRAVLTAGMGAVGAGVLAACGSSSGSAPAASSPADTSAAASAPAASSAAATSAAPATTSAVATSAPAAATTKAATKTATKAATSGFTVAKSKIPVGSGAYFADDAVVITQPAAGEFKAFTSVCTHQGCPVTMFSGAKMICPCHGSEYSVKDGSVLQGPAVAPLAAKAVTVDGADVVVAKT